MTAVFKGRACSLTVMDESDPDITFDADGVCNHVQSARYRLQNETFRGPEGQALLERAVDRIKADGRGREYDCIAGVSGGVDSSYTACLARDLGLRVLALHVDVGWNNNVAVGNVERLIRHGDVDLQTEVVDWREVKDLQRAYFRASVLDIECVADHAINASLFHEAGRRKIRWILNGMNVSSEAILPKAWIFDKRDASNLRAIHAAYGERPLKTFPTLSPFQLANYIFRDKIKFFPLLNYFDYDKEAAVATMARRFGFVPYARKHGESMFTRFFQEYFLPRKFGIDKRKAHFSSLIVAGQMSRDEAVAKLSEPLYRPGEDRQDMDYVAKKLGFSTDQLEALIAAPPRSHGAFANTAWLFDRNTVWAQLARSVAKNESIGKALRAARRS